MSDNFADRLAETILKTGSYLCAGFDPQPQAFPEFLKEEATAISPTDEEFVCTLLQSFYTVAIDALKRHIAAIKPNIAFFERYGLSGMLALAEILSHARRVGMLVIMDAKRGDIGSTAEAYADAFLGVPEFLGRRLSAFPVDALTVSPFLGFDTLEPFITRCQEHGKGVFVLVKTSNPGSSDLQDVKSLGREESISVRVARHLA
ncbi:MAG: orotidine-5'-phosphate decarboxylase, partial [Proteobacteria bacterium]|nr:orotidine-5'-phosphate decarboxylase [Pseudomonadota bacterium]